MRVTYIFYLIVSLLLLQQNQVECHIPRQFKSDDYYKVLGLSKRFVSKAEIKKAYYKLALKYHPDKLKNKNDIKERDKGEAIFVKVTEAYDILRDDKLKGIYDTYGKRGLEAHARGMNPEDAGFGRSSSTDPGNHSSNRGTGSRSGSGGSESETRPRYSHPHFFNYGFHDGDSHSQQQHKRFTSHKNHFKFGDWEFETDQIPTDFNDPMAFIMFAMTMCTIVLFFILIFTIITSILFFPITLYLIWRCCIRRPRRV